MAGGRGAPLHAASGGWNQASLGTWPHKHPLILQRGSGPQPWQPRAVSSATRAGHPGDAGPGKRMGRPQTHWGASLATLRAFVPLVGPGGFPHSRAGDRGICITAAGWLPVPACGVDAARDSSGGRGRREEVKLRSFPLAQEEMGMGTHLVDDTWATSLWSSGQDSRPSCVLDICGGCWDPHPPIWGSLPPPCCWPFTLTHTRGLRDQG